MYTMSYKTGNPTKERVQYSTRYHIIVRKKRIWRYTLLGIPLFEKKMKTVNQYSLGDVQVSTLTSFTIVILQTLTVPPDSVY